MVSLIVLVITYFLLRREKYKTATKLVDTVVGIYVTLFVVAIVGNIIYHLL